MSVDFRRDSMLNSGMGATMGLAAGYGIHGSASEERQQQQQPRQQSFTCSPSWGCSLQQIASCPGGSSRCPPTSNNGNGSSPESLNQLAYDCPALSWPSTAESHSPQTFQPTASLSPTTSFSAFVTPQASQSNPRKRSRSPPAAVSMPTAKAVNKMDPHDDRPSHLPRIPDNPSNSPNPPISQRSPQSASTPSRPNRLPHSVIERRYRDNLNRQLETLRTRLPDFKDTFACSQEIEDSGLPAKWPSKAVIIAAAIKHIDNVESERDRAKAQAKALQDQVEGLQALVRCDNCSILKYLESLQLNGDGSGG